jgi:bifunctional isochorismate lyase/aryl carrier protein
MLLPFSPASLTALLIVDMQNAFFTEVERRHNLEQVVENINRASLACDQAGLPVFHVVSQYKPDKSDWDLKMLEADTPELIEGTAEAAILPGIEVRPGHQLAVKTRYSAFFKTDLAARLYSIGVKRVITAGAYTHHCVNATVFDAYCHNIIPGILVDAVMSHRVEESNLMVERMRRNRYHVLTTTEFINQCEELKRESLENTR